MFAFYALAHIAPTLLTFATPRFRLPLMPLLLIGTAVLLVSAGEVWRAVSPARRGLAVGLAVAMAGVLLWGRAAFLSPMPF